MKTSVSERAAAVKVGESLNFFLVNFFFPKKNKNSREKNVSVSGFAGGLSFCDDDDIVVVVASSKKFQH